VYAAGKGELIHYNGSSWSTVHVPTCWQSYIQAIWGSGPNDVWLVTDAGNDGTNCAYAIQHNTGSGFVPVAGVAYSFGGAITGSGTDVVYLSSSSGFLALRPSGATHITLPTGVAVTAMWAAAPNDLFLVGSDSKIYRYDGTTFTPMTTPTTAHLEAIWGSSANDVYAVGSVVLHFDGSTWTQETSDTSPGGTRVGGMSVWGTTAAAPVYIGAPGGVVWTGVR
jgi:hypothetical protein